MDKLTGLAETEDIENRETRLELGPRELMKCKCEQWGPRGCLENLTVTYPDGEILNTIPWEGPGECHDCKASPRKRHHPSCDVERCPRCQQQFISCRCLVNPKQEDEDKRVVAAYRRLDGILGQKYLKV